MERRQFIAGATLAAASVSTLPLAVAYPRVDRTAWDSAMRNLETITQRRDAYRAYLNRKYGAKAAPYEEEVQYDDLTDSMVEAETVLAEMPAPDVAALRWKMEHLLESGGVRTPSWSLSYVKQTKADMRRLLK